jgi:hypothetical protein
MTNAIKLLSILPIKRPILFVTFLILILHLLYSPFYLARTTYMLLQPCT